MPDIQTLTRLGFHSGSTHYGAEPVATHCRECGRPLENVAGKVEKDFCPREVRPCRDRFTARRRERGAHLYDLLMSERYAADGQGVWAIQQAENLMKEWHEDDLETREGRPSWNVPPKPE